MNVLRSFPNYRSASRPFNRGAPPKMALWKMTGCSISLINCDYLPGVIRQSALPFPAFGVVLGNSRPLTFAFAYLPCFPQCRPPHLAECQPGTATATQPFGLRME